MGLNEKFNFFNLWKKKTPWQVNNDLSVIPLFKEINNYTVSRLLNCIFQVVNCMVGKLYHNRLLKIRKAKKVKY